MQIDEVIGKYVSLRDKKAEIKKEYDGKIASIDDALGKIEAALLKAMQDSGLDSMKTEAGTAYRSSRVSAKVADWDQFLPFVIKNESWEFLERRVSKEAVEQFKAANEDLPPGISWSETFVVNVRRS
jgi:hypothetical protein